MTPWPATTRRLRCSRTLPSLITIAATPCRHLVVFRKGGRQLRQSDRAQAGLCRSLCQSRQRAYRPAAASMRRLPVLTGRLRRGRVLPEAYDNRGKAWCRSSTFPLRQLPALTRRLRSSLIMLALISIGPICNSSRAISARGWRRLRMAAGKGSCAIGNYSQPLLAVRADAQGKVVLVHWRARSGGRTIQFCRYVELLCGMRGPGSCSRRKPDCMAPVASLEQRDPEEAC